MGLDPNSGKAYAYDELSEETKPKLSDVKRDWVMFTIGEELTIKGIIFEVKDISDQRLVLKFKKKA